MLCAVFSVCCVHSIVVCDNGLLCGEGSGGSENTSSLLMVSGMGSRRPWGDFGRLGWSSGSSWEVEMLIFH